jgi:hypothetical protein
MSRRKVPETIPRGAGDQGPLAGPEDQAARRYLRTFAAVVGIGLIAVALLNYTINPLGLYRDHRSPAGARDQRWVKLEQLQRADPTTQALILGSSRVRGLDPGEVERRFGLKTFNAAVGGGGVEDWLALTRLATDERRLPLRLLIIGVDAGSLIRPHDRIDSPADVPALRRHLTHPWKRWLASRKYLLAPEQTVPSWGLLRRRIFGAGSEEAREFAAEFNAQWRPDGFNPSFPPGDSAAMIALSRDLFTKYSAPDRANLADFTALIRLARDRHLTVIAFLTPDHPDLAAALAQTLYPKVRRETEQYLRAGQDQGLIFCDLSTLAFNWNRFVDVEHSGADSGTVIIDRLHDCAYWAGAL